MTKEKLAIKLAIDIMERNVNKYINHGIYEVSDTDGAVHVEFAEAINILNEMLGQEPCIDAVSREDLRDAISDLTYWHANQYGELRLGGAGKYATVYKTNDVERMADTLPPVTPIRPKGKWETGYTYPDGEYWKCSVCKELIKVRFPMHFCPNCSADMRGEKE